ncbi:MAG: two-component system, OmpR family, response regulator [Frankiaceae bacterium]|nr:two-component system, OmpR family, response regulator [Frankiaceae bacterium]MDQ1649560.1 two-component system, OmpR family, response regulator [Frankiaceae bacterium]MDQ1672987.1 two-component system, OmpR family, response regulator [Frankiaceae bacterium]
MSRLLVVDDDPVVLNLVEIRLKNGGHRVITAGGPEEALRLIDTHGVPDLAVLDVTLPGMTGLDLLGQLRSRPGAASLPTIFLSARVLQADIEAGRSLGATYLTKPFVASALLAAVDRELAAATAAVPDGW